MSVGTPVLDKKDAAEPVAASKKPAVKRWNLIPWYVESFSSSGVPGSIKK